MSSEPKNVRSGLATLRERLTGCALCAAVLTLIMGCTVGPDFVTPAVTAQEDWLESTDPSLSSDAVDDGAWWEVFGDPVMDLR